jgi:hypothetical protein
MIETFFCRPAVFLRVEIPGGGPFVKKMAHIQVTIPRLNLKQHKIRIYLNSKTVDLSSLVSTKPDSFRYIREVFIKARVKSDSCCINSGGPAILVMMKALFQII